ncbi:MAG: lysophospholipid acyltransferase family protein [Desulfobacterales bacterium]
MLRTAFIVCLIVIETGFMSVIVILASFFDRKGDAVHTVAKAWARGILFSARVKVTLKGLSHIDPAKSYIYMPNHLSQFDIPVLLGSLPVQFRWLAKVELFKIPVFGFALRRAGYIGIDRSNMRSAIRSLKRAGDIVRSGVSVLVFPEGTRSLDGNLHPFKKGGFVMAMSSGVSILPIVLHGTWDIMPAKKLSIRPGHAILEILAPIDVSAYAAKNKEVLMADVRAAIQQAIERQAQADSFVETEEQSG